MHRRLVRRLPLVLRCPEGLLSLGTPLCSILKDLRGILCRGRWTTQYTRQNSALSLAAVLGCRPPLWETSILWEHHRCHQQRRELSSALAPCYILMQEALHSLRVQHHFEPRIRASRL